MPNEKILINANDAFEIVTDLAVQADTKGVYKAFWDAARAIQKMPAVDAVEVVHGYWTTTDTILGICCICSACGSCPTMEYKYCPYCGAKMDGERRESDG